MTAAFSDTGTGLADAVSVPLDNLVALPFAVITCKEVEPLWPGWIARRHVTMVVAPGGTGKGLWTVDIAARVTTGSPWPGEPADAVREPEAVVLVAPEDDPNEAVAWRLKAAGADTSLVFNLTVLADGSPFILPDSVPVLRDAILQVEQLTGRKAGLVIIDPLMATVERSISSNIAARKVTGPLEMLARELGPAVILTHHTVKSGAAAGSKGLTDAMRHVLRIDRPAGAEPGTPVRVVTVEKSNMAGTDAQMRYVLDGDGESCRVLYPGDAMAPAVNRGYAIDPGATAYSPAGSLASMPTGKHSSPGSQAKMAGCKHSHTKFGTPAQCGNCPAAKLLAPKKVPVVAVSWQLLFCEDKGTPVTLGKAFASDASARDAAAKHAGHALPWKPGDHNSQMAATLLKGGKVAAYTVFPNT